VDETVEELWEGGLEAVGADEAGRLPEELGGEDELGAVVARGARADRRGGGARRAAQEPDGGLAVQAGDGDNFIEELGLLGATPRPQIARAFDTGVLPEAGSRHGASSRWRRCRGPHGAPSGVIGG
jgi:hypothetical protein